MRGERGRGGAYIQPEEEEAEADSAASGSGRPEAGVLSRGSSAGRSAGKTQPGASLAAAPVRRGGEEEEEEEEGGEEGRGEGAAAAGGAQLRQEGAADGTPAMAAPYSPLECSRSD